MTNSIFSPKLRGAEDSLEAVLLRISQYVLVGVMVLLPILFVPDRFLPQATSKTFFVLVGALLVAALYSFFLLRVGTIRFVAPVIVSLLWAVVFLAAASGLLSGDRSDAFFGDGLQTQSVLFLGLLATIITLTAIVLDSRHIIMRGFAVLGLTTLLIQAWLLLRIMFGAEILPFGVFSDVTSSPLGSFNDVALFSGMVIVGCIVSLVQLSLRRVGMAVVGLLIVTSLLLLAIINFFAVWLVVGSFALLVLLYALTRDRLFAPEGDEILEPVPRFALMLLALVFVIATLFVVAGNYLGSALSTATNIQYLEVRPSLSATVDIMRAVYQEDAFLGIGPNRFEDAWRLHKDSTISETIFWNTNFTAGSGYVPTAFISLGLFGGFALIAFLCSVLYVGYRMLLSSVNRDPYWYFIATTAFASAAYLWLMSFVYVPGATLLFMAAFWTGLCLAAYAALVPSATVAVVCTQYRAQAFVLIGAVMVVVAGVVGTLYVSGKQFASQVVYASAVERSLQAAPVEEIDALLAQAQALYASDLYVAERVRLRLAEIAPLLSITEPTAADQQRFGQLARESLELSQLAVGLDRTQPINHSLRGSAWAVWALGGAAAEALEPSLAAMATAKLLDPRNPEYETLNAQLLVRLGDVARAREQLQAAIAVKPNYLEALFLLAQLDIQEGRTADAIAITQAIVSIEPQNPIRHFQLGALFAAEGNLEVAIASLQNAVLLDQNFANARYLLALAYIDSDRVPDALTELRVVLALNPDSREVQDLIAQLESGDITRPNLGLTPPVSDPTSTEQDGEVTTADSVPDTSLLTPVNRGAGTNNDSSSATTDNSPVQEVGSEEATTTTE